MNIADKASASNFRIGEFGSIPFIYSFSGCAQLRGASNFCCCCFPPESKVFPGSRNLAPDSCVVIVAITTQESGARLHEPGKTLLKSAFLMV